MSLKTKPLLTAAESTARAMRRNATRVNPPQLLHTNLPTKPVKPSAAPAPAMDMWRRGTYSTGDGDARAAQRPGAQDFLQFKSRGIG